MEGRRTTRAAAQRDEPASETTTAPAGEREAPGPRFPHGMRNAATAYALSASTDVAAYEDLPGHHPPTVRNLIATTNDESYHTPLMSFPPRPRTGTHIGISPVCQTR
jgi:hypothetical protein